MMIPLLVASALAQDAGNCVADSCAIVDDLDLAISAMDSFDWYDDPRRLEDDYEPVFDALPLQGKADRVPWTDTYWPETDGGIANRWQTGEHRDYEKPDFDTLLEMSEDEIALLSPTEKYDLLVGNYEYALTYRVQAENGANESAWAGLCHGWTPASIHYEEPQPVVMVNPDGVVIPFGSSDVKALLTYFEGEVVRNSRYSESEMPYGAIPRTMGSVCLSNDVNDPSCQDTNAGAFHIVLANQLGLRGEAFGIDATTTSEKWNQPVHEYSSVVLGRREPTVGASEHAVEELVLRTEVTWTAEVEPEWEPLLGTASHKDVTKTYTYTVELNEQGEIVGGQWVLLLQDGSITISQAIDYLENQDDNGDGRPDLNKDQVRDIIWSHFDFPDYAWTQDPAEFSDSFRQAQGPYELLSSNATTRQKLYDYMAELGPLYEASLRGEQ